MGDFKPTMVWAPYVNYESCGFLKKKGLMPIKKAIPRRASDLD